MTLSWRVRAACDSSRFIHQRGLVDERLAGSMNDAWSSKYRISVDHLANLQWQLSGRVGGQGERCLPDLEV